MKAWALFSPSGKLGRPWSYCQLWYPFPLLLSCITGAPPFFACISSMSHFSFCSSGGEDHSELGRAVFSSGRFSTEPHGCFSLSLSALAAAELWNAVKTPCPGTLLSGLSPSQGSSYPRGTNSSCLCALHL